MDEHHQNFLVSSSSGGGGGGSDWRTRSPDNADQEYFIDKMRMLKARLRKYEEENRVLYRCLAEQKSDVKEALKEKCLVINNVQYEMTELKKHILLLLGVLTEDQPPPPPMEGGGGNQENLLHLLTQSLTPSLPDHEPSAKSLWVSRNKSLEENFKKELKKAKDLERQIAQLQDHLHVSERDRDDLQEKNAFLEEENNIQREQIALLEDSVRELEEEAVQRAAEAEDAATQTEIRGVELMRIVEENVEQILCLVGKLAELQQRNEALHGKHEEARRVIRGLRQDFHDRGKVMSELENELNALKLRRSGRRCEWGEEDGDEERVTGAVLNNFDASVFLSPTSSTRSCSSTSSRSSAEFEEEEEDGWSTNDRPQGYLGQLSEQAVALVAAAAADVLMMTVDWAHLPG